MPHPPNFDAVGIRADEEDTVVADTKPQFAPALQGLHISDSGMSESVKRRENVHGVWSR
jgi:hypothetical protein